LPFDVLNDKGELNDLCGGLGRHLQQVLKSIETLVKELTDVPAFKSNKTNLHNKSFLVKDRFKT
jgi:hypothetical protein